MREDGSVGRKRAASHWLVSQHPLLVVAEARLVVGEEHLADELSTAADAGLLEDVLQVLLDRVRRDEAFGDLRRRVALQDESRDVLLVPDPEGAITEQTMTTLDPGS